MTDRETVERVALVLQDAGYCDYVHAGNWGGDNERDIGGDCEESAALLRALLARAEAAERERDEAREIAKHLRVTKLVPLPPQAFPWEAHP